MPTPKICPKCYAAHPADAERCPKCGHVHEPAKPPKNDRIKQLAYGCKSRAGRKRHLDE